MPGLKLEGKFELEAKVEDDVEMGGDEAVEMQLVRLDTADEMDEPSSLLNL